MSRSKLLLSNTTNVIKQYLRVDEESAFTTENWADMDDPQWSDNASDRRQDKALTIRSVEKTRDTPSARSRLHPSTAAGSADTSKTAGSSKARVRATSDAAVSCAVYTRGTRDSASSRSSGPHSRQLTPISCHFADCQALLVTIRVNKPPELYIYLYPPKIGNAQFRGLSVFHRRRPQTP